MRRDRISRTMPQAIVTTSHHPTSLKPDFSPIERSFYSADPFGNKLRSGDERTLFTAGLI